MSYLLSFILHVVVLGGAAFYGWIGADPPDLGAKKTGASQPGGPAGSYESNERKVEITSDRLAAHLQLRLREWKERREDKEKIDWLLGTRTELIAIKQTFSPHNPYRDRQIEHIENKVDDLREKLRTQYFLKFKDSDLRLEHLFQTVGETLHRGTQFRTQNPNAESATVQAFQMDLFEETMQKVQQIFVSMKRMDLEFKRVFNPKRANGHPEWLIYLNFIRYKIWDRHHKIYDSHQPLLTDLIASKRGNALANTLFLSGFFLHPKWKEILPPHKVAIRLYNNFIEPLILIEPSESHPQGLELNLFTGVTSYPEDTLGRIYDWRLLFFAYLEYLDKDTVVSKSDLLLFDSKRDPDHNSVAQILTYEWHHWVATHPEVVEIEPVFRNTNLLFAPEPYDYPGEMPIDNVATNFQHLTPQPTVKRNLGQRQDSESTQGKDIPPQEAAEHSDQSDNPDTSDDLLKELEKSAGEAMKEMAGMNGVDLTSPEAVKRMMSLLQTAKTVTEKEGMANVFKKLGGLDAATLARLMQSDEILTTSDLKKMESLRDAFKLLLNRRVKVEKSNDFVSVPEARVATAFELENEFRGNIPYLVKYFKKEEVIRRVKESRKDHQAEGFPFRLLKPLMEVVFRSRGEVDRFNELDFNEKFEWLRTQAEAVLDYHLENSQLDMVPSILLAPFSKNNENIMTYTTQVDGSIRQDHLPDVLMALEEARLMHRHMNHAMKYVFRRAIPMPGTKGGKLQRYYYSYEPMIDLFAVLPLSTGAAVADPLQYMLDINKLPMNERHVFISLQRNFTRWREEIWPAGEIAPNEKLAELYDKTEAALKEYWKNGFYTAMGIEKDEIPEKRRYFPTKALENRRDLFLPYVSVLPFLVDEQKVQYLHPFKPKGDELVIQVTFNNHDGDPIIGPYRPGVRGLEQGREDAPDGAERVDVRGQGDETKREDAFEDKTRLQTSIFISARVFLAAILSLPDELLRYPVTQDKLLSRFTEETISLLQDEFSDWSSANQILSFYNISPLFSATDQYKTAVPDVNPMPKLEELYQGESKFAVEIRYIDDEIQAANRKVRPPSGKTLYPKSLAKYVQEMAILALGKEIRNSRLMERDPKKIAARKLDRAKFNGRIQDWRRDNLREQYFDLWMSPIDSLYPHFGQSTFSTRKTGIFAEHHILKVEENCGMEIKFEEFFDRTENTNVNGNYYMKVSQADCDRPNAFGNGQSDPRDIPETGSGESPSEGANTPKPGPPSGKHNYDNDGDNDGGLFKL